MPVVKGQSVRGGKAVCELIQRPGKPGRAGLLNSRRDHTFGVALENRAGPFPGGFEHVKI